MNPVNIVCRVCGEKFNSFEERKVHIYATKHHYVDSTAQAPLSGINKTTHNYKKTANPYATHGSNTVHATSLATNTDSVPFLDGMKHNPTTATIDNNTEQLLKKKLLESRMSHKKFPPAHNNSSAPSVGTLNPTAPAFNPFGDSNPYPFGGNTAKPTNKGAVPFAANNYLFGADTTRPTAPSAFVSASQHPSNIDDSLILSEDEGDEGGMQEECEDDDGDELFQQKEDTFDDGYGKHEEEKTHEVEAVFAHPVDNKSGNNNKIVNQKPEIPKVLSVPTLHPSSSSSDIAEVS